MIHGKRYGFICSAKRKDFWKFVEYFKTIPDDSMVMLAGYAGNYAHVSGSLRFRGVKTEAHLVEYSTSDGKPLNRKPNRQEKMRAFKQRNSEIVDNCEILIAGPCPSRKGGVEFAIEQARNCQKEIVIL